MRPTPANSLPILAGVQPAELHRRGATLSLGRRAMSLDTCSTQHSPVHRVQLHGASNRDTHLYPQYNNSTTSVRRSGRLINVTTEQQQHMCGAVGGSSMERGVGGQPHKTLHFISRHQ